MTRPNVVCPTLGPTDSVFTKYLNAPRTRALPILKKWWSGKRMQKCLSKEFEYEVLDQEN